MLTALSATTLRFDGRNLRGYRVPRAELLPPPSLLKALWPELEDLKKALVARQFGNRPKGKDVEHHDAEVRFFCDFFSFLVSSISQHRVSLLPLQFEAFVADLDLNPDQRDSAAINFVDVLLHLRTVLIQDSAAMAALGMKGPQFEFYPFNGDCAVRFLPPLPPPYFS